MGRLIDRFNKHRIRKTESLGIAKEIASGEYVASEFFDLLASENVLLHTNAGWVIYPIIDFHPELFQDHMAALVKIVESDFPYHQAVIRGVFRALDKVGLDDESLQGRAIDAAFRWLAGNHEQTAVYAFTMGFLEQMCKPYPELLPELCDEIERQMPYRTVGFKSRGRKILAKR